LDQARIGPDSEQDATRFYNEGFALWQQGRLDEAIAAYDTALRLRPAYPEALCAGGFLLHQAGRREQALKFYDEALRHRPDYAVALANRGKLLNELDQPDAAIESLCAALSVDATNASAWINLGVSLNDLGRYAEAIPAFDEAALLDPTLEQSFHNRGHAYLKLHRLDEALADFERALALKANYPEAECGRAVVLKELERFDEAASHFEAALALDPHADHALANKGALLLLQGQFKEGWDLYEHRWAKGKKPAHKLPLPYLDRIEDLSPGEKILVWDDQALGDIVQFCRYLPLLVEKGADVVLLARASAHRLLKSLGTRIEIVERLPSLDGIVRHVGLGSLPRAFHADRTTIPARCPYLRAEQDRVDLWRRRIGRHGLKIGVSWQGSIDARADLMRSFPLAALAPLGNVPGVRLISLQKGEVASPPALQSAGVSVEILGDDFDCGPDAFIDTAAVMQCLDLVVSCDTSVAHLAGALGRPVLVALKKVPEWRWLLDCEDTPWYPTMQLYRQHTRNEWTGIFVAMARDLSEAIQQRTAKNSGARASAA
jgi:tetratricopeptide (TPR) repeat protein